MKTHRYVGVFSILSLAAGCASAQPPAELVDARAAYQRASAGSTAQLNPADLHVAKQTLDKAEKSFSDDGDSPQTKDFAYVAGRRVETAEARARVVEAGRQKQQLAAQMQASQAAALKSTSSALASTREELAAGKEALQTEQQRRIEADKRAKDAAATLAQIGSVKQEPRGMVITLSGAVLFATNKSELLPAAQAKLSEVAQALTQQDKDSKIVIEGHTDSQGADDANKELSQRRAESVRSYLVSHGMAADRVVATGFGEARPIADNKSAEGRANNRRVEIVVEPTAPQRNTQ